MKNPIILHYRLLYHQGFGVTELRTFNGIPKVAYCNNENDFVRLCQQMDGEKDVYVGVQPRPLRFFDYAPNRWKIARPRPNSNCATDEDIEFITNIFFDCDVHTKERGKSPATNRELKQTLKAIYNLYCRKEFNLFSTICESGNGHYLLVNIKPFVVKENTGFKLKMFEKNIINSIAHKYTGIKFDSVANLSRVMRVIGTKNIKGQASPDRLHRRSMFITVPIFTRSEQLRHVIWEIKTPKIECNNLPIGKDIPADLKQLDKCLFIQWCIQHPTEVAEPAWFDLITNLVHLKDGPRLIHMISKRDKIRYKQEQTQRRITRYLQTGYKPKRCENLSGMKGHNGHGYFECPNLGKCKVVAPMYLALKEAL